MRKNTSASGFTGKDDYFSSSFLVVFLAAAFFGAAFLAAAFFGAAFFSFFSSAPSSVFLAAV
ncbi:MAG TPA: hypothetical protein QGG18_03540, partial [Rhodospirillales bacterium]|nr:hypothetical protein [Rhodospirillales bacterium]